MCLSTIRFLRTKKTPQITKANSCKSSIRKIQTAYLWSSAKASIDCMEMCVRPQQVFTSETLKRALGSLTKYEIIRWI